MDKHPQLSFVRTLIDNIDAAILAILAHRAQVVSHVIEHKFIQGKALAQTGVRQKNIDEVLDFSQQQGLRKDFARVLLEYLFQSSSDFLSSTMHKNLHEFFWQEKYLLRDLNTSLKNLDMAFCSLLAERMRLVGQIGELKKIYDLPVLDPKRWQEVLESKKALAVSLQINPEVVEQLYNLIHEEALLLESGVKSKNN